MANAHLPVVILKFFMCIALRTQIPRRYLDSKLSPGTLTAPGRFCLVLLRSRPDTVHRFPSRKTQASTPLIKGSSTNRCPQRNITPAIADCRYKVPLTPRLHESLFYRVLGKKSMGNRKNGVASFCLSAVFFIFNNLVVEQEIQNRGYCNCFFVPQEQYSIKKGI